MKTLLNSRKDVINRRPIWMATQFQPKLVPAQRRNLVHWSQWCKRRKKRNCNAGFKNWNIVSLSTFGRSMRPAGQRKHAIYTIYKGNFLADLPISNDPPYPWQRGNGNAGWWSGERGS